MELVDRVALVTGAGAGIGRAVAVRLGAEGMRVAVLDVDEAGGEATAGAIRDAGGDAWFTRADVTSEAMVSAALAGVEAAWGGLDVLVNNAGGVDEPHYPAAPAEAWRRCVALNLLAPMQVIQAALPLLRRSRGAVVNVASMAGVGGGAYGAPEYGAAKAGLIRLTESLASLHERDGVRVNCVAPNFVLTEKVRALLAAMPEAERAALPPPFSAPEEIAAGVVRLLRDDALAGRVLIWCGTEPNLAPENRWAAWAGRPA